MIEYVPTPEQDVIIQHLLDLSRAGVWAGMGMGKTSAVLTGLNLLSAIEDGVFPALILAPLRVAQSTWPDEVLKWAHLRHLRIVAIVGTEKQRIAALNTPADIYTINYENIPWLIQYLASRGLPWHFKTIVADEATRLKSFRLRQGGSRARALAKVAHTVTTRFIELTGTPTPKGLVDLWGQMWFLDAGERLGRTFTAFEQRWFEKGYDGYSVKPRLTAQPEIEQKLADICVSLRPDVEKPLFNPIYVDLPPAARKMYKDMEKHMFAQIGEHGVEAFNAAARTNKCLQLANGAAYIEKDAEKYVEVHDAKIKALDSVIEEAAGMPVLVAYHFRSDLDRLRKAFPKGRVLDKNPKTIRDWNEGKIPILFAHPASAGHGLNLQDGGNILAFFGINWNLEEHDQIIERIGPMRQKQAGHNRPVFVHYILAKNTVDDMVLERLKSKRDVQDILLEALRARSQIVA